MSQNSQESACVRQGLLIDKVAELSPAALLEKGTLAQVFSLNFAKSLNFYHPHFLYYGSQKLFFHFIKSCIGHLNNSQTKVVVWLKKILLKATVKENVQ